MKFLLALVTFTALWLPATVLAQVRCESLFVTLSSPELGRFGLNAKAMEAYYDGMSRTTKTASGISSKAGIVTKEIFTSAVGMYGTFVTKFRARPNLQSSDNSFQSQVSENIDYVLESYSERRDWSPELREHLKKEAELYAEQSTYIEVRKINPFTKAPGVLMGTMKIVKVGIDTTIKKLPLETDFSVTLPNNAGRKFEPANFVVDKDKNKIGTSEIFSQLILHAREQLKDPRHEPNKMMYYTPGDRLGVKMYGRLGFEAVPGFEAPIKEGTKEWWMIGSTAENLANLPQRLEKNKAQWLPEDIEWMTQLTKNFGLLQGSKTEVSRSATRNVTVRKGEPIKELGLYITEPYTHDGKNYRTLKIDSIQEGELHYALRLFDSEFPLKNGWHRNTEYVQMFYQDGVFKLMSNQFSLTIKTDGAFSKPEHLDLKFSDLDDLSASF